MERYYLYRHIRLDTNEVFYIGIGKKYSYDYNRKDGIYERARDKCGRNRFWKSIINKTNYKIEIVQEFNSLEEAYNKEKELISFYGRRDLHIGSLCNLTSGGDGVNTLSVETRKQISIRNSRIFRNRIGKLHPGSKHIFKYNMKRQLVCEYDSLTEASKKNNCNSNSLTTARKRLCDYMGHFWLTNPKDIEYCVERRIVPSQSKRIIQLSLGNNFIAEWESAALAYGTLITKGKKNSQIGRCCNNKILSAFGYKWIYAKDYFL